MLVSTPQQSSLSQTADQSVASSSPVRPGRLRALSYLRLHSRSDAPPLTRTTSSPNTSLLASTDRAQATQTQGIQPGEASTTTAPSQSSTSPPTRARAATVSSPTASTPMEPAAGAAVAVAAAAPNTHATSSRPVEQHPTIKFIPHIETRSSRPSLHFKAITKTLKTPAAKIRVGRYTERDTASSEEEVLPVGFKSKVVSRRHCELWCTAGQWYVKDVKSSSGTFLNHVRLSSPGAESRAFPVNDGDVIQLGIDFKGGEEVIFRCVKIRVEVNRGWQKALNNFNTAAHQNLLKLAAAGASKQDSDSANANKQECSICLNPIAPLQCLFYAPCSHVWHYKCVRGLVHGPHWPNFLCPNCRLVADLEADVEPPEDEEEYVDMSSDNGEASVPQTEAQLRALDLGTTEDGAAAGAASTPHPPHVVDSSPEHTGDESNRGTASRDPVTPPRPRNIPMPTSKFEAPNTSLGAESSLTPLIAEGLLTPRNDTGPFVFDGAARHSPSRHDRNIEQDSA